MEFEAHVWAEDPVVTVAINDVASPDMWVTLGYIPEGDQLRLARLTLSGRIQLGSDEQLSTESDPLPEGFSVSQVRDMRLSSLERTARELARKELTVSHQATRESADRASQLVEDVLRCHPELSGHALTDRRFAVQLRLAEVAREYRDNIGEGLADPVAEIARRRDVKGSTARAWVYRARREGYLKPAAGPTPGESTHRRNPLDSIGDADRTTPMHGPANAPAEETS